MQIIIFVLMTNKIGLVEFAFHNEVLRAYIIALLETDFKISIFTNEFNHNQIYDFRDHPGINWVVKPNGESYSDYFKRVHSHMEECRLLILTTLNHQVCKLKPVFPSKTVLLIHDNHYLFEPGKYFSASSGIRDNTRDLIKIAAFTLFSKKKSNLKFLDRIDYLACPAESVQAYISEKPYYKKYHYNTVLDFAVHDQNLDLEEPAKEIVITIPGNISNKSRDYHLVYEVLEKIKPRIEQKVIVNLLGISKGITGRNHKKLLKSLSGDLLEVKVFDGFIDQASFDSVMKETHFLFLPLLQHMKYDICLEKNGYSCVSGNINDIAKYGLPAIIPHFYPLNDSLEQMVERYELFYNLPDLLLNWIQNKPYLEMRTNAHQLLEPINAKNMGQKFQEVILKLVD